MLRRMTTIRLFVAACLAMEAEWSLGGIDTTPDPHDAAGIYFASCSRIASNSLRRVSVVSG